MEHPSLSKTLNTWAQTVGLLFASVFGFYTFFYTDVLKPKRAPVNISIDLKVNRSGLGATTSESGSSEGLRAITFEASATNPSSRTVILLPTAFVVTGLKYKVNESDTFDEHLANNPIDQPHTGNYFMRYSRIDKSQVVAIGEFITDRRLNPGEVVKRTLLIHVPDRKYDAINIYVAVPSARDTGRLKVKWIYSNEYGLEKEVYRIGKYQTERELCRSEFDDYELQTAVWRGTISLW